MMKNSNPWEEELKKLENEEYELERGWVKPFNPWEEELKKIEDID